MPIFRLSEKDIGFPPVHLADPFGRLAIGGDLSPERLLHAYQLGIFPWFNPNEPIVWWSTDPRCVLYPDELKVAKSMRPIFNQKKFSYSFDRSFRDVMTACREVRATPDGQGTWISDDMIEAYCRLHELGFAHSVEVWQGEELVGGLYGIAIGKVFFGESMFAKVANASKAGFITLVRFLEKMDFELIDCQQKTRHLQSLGARTIDRSYFSEILAANESKKTMVGNWGKFLE